MRAASFMIQARARLCRNRAEDMMTPVHTAVPEMTFTRVGLFLALSILAHVAVSLALLSGRSAEQGVVGNGVADATGSVLSISLQAPAVVPMTQDFSLSPAAAAVPLDHATTQVDAPSAPSTSAADAPMLTDVVAPPLADAGATTYLNTGRLTRLPRPLDEVDLNVPEITEVVVDGERALTILVNADGTVDGAEWTDVDAAAQVYLQRVAERFQQVRFVPGEVDGVAVNAVFRIMISSEPTNVNAESDAVPPEVAKFLREATEVIEPSDID